MPDPLLQQPQLPSRFRHPGGDMRLCLALAAAIAGVMAAVPIPALATEDGGWSEAALDRAFARLEARADLQRGLPAVEAEPEPEPKPPEPEEEEGPDWNLEWLKPALPYIAGVLLMVALALMFPGTRRWLNSRGLRQQEAAPDPVPAERAAAAASLAEADALAAAGEHARACGALLVYVLPRLARAFRAGWKPSITAREALRLLKLPEEAHEQLAFVVGMAEIGRFAGGRIGAEEYDRSRLCIVELLQVTAQREPQLREAGHG